MNKISVRLVLAAAPVLAGLAGTAQADTTWRRAADWVPGASQGSTVNNPSLDGSGKPVWQYEYTTGGSLGSSSPWYKNPGTLMKWDGDFYGSEIGVWSRSDDKNPPISRLRLVHNVAESVFQYMPTVRWMNPVGDGAELAIDGTLRVVWDGQGGMGFDNDTDVVIAKYDASTGETDAIYATTVSKPHAGPSITDFIDLPVHLTGISLDEGDNILVSLRSADAVYPGAWNGLRDDLTFSVASIPAPGAATLLGLAGLAAARRRR